jgi:hypothetical protein
MRLVDVQSSWNKVGFSDSDVNPADPAPDNSSGWAVTGGMLSLLVLMLLMLLLLMLSTFSSDSIPNILAAGLIYEM